MLAKTPPPPYYAVIFSSVRTEEDDENYSEMAETMAELATHQPGYLGIESARNEIGITVSYWKDLESIKLWKQNAEHRVAQRLGLEKWYSKFVTRIAKVERDYDFNK